MADYPNALGVLLELLRASEYVVEEMDWIVSGAQSSRVPTQDEAVARNLLKDALFQAEGRQDDE
jgi:hypothetical protein